MKGGWKETRADQRPILAEAPVSESRMASLNPFETKRKKALAGASSRVRELFVAEGTGLVSNLLHIKRLILNYYFSRNAPHERFQHCKRLTW